MLAPSAPHITEELWSRRLGRGPSRGRRSTAQTWPEFDETAVVEATARSPIQVNGKVRDKVEVPAGISEIELDQIVLSRDKIVADRSPAGSPCGPSTRAAASW